MIAGTTDTNFTDSKATGELAQDSADNANEAVKHKSSLYKSTSEPPLDDLTPYSDGDQWYVVDDNETVIRMYQLTDGAWVLYKWDQEALSVKTLSALSADLGQINAGTLNAVDINGATMKLIAPPVEQSPDATPTTAGGSLYIQATGTNPVNGRLWNEEYWIDPNGFHEKYSMGQNASLQNDSVWINRGRITFIQGPGRPNTTTASNQTYISNGKAVLPFTQVNGSLYSTGDVSSDTKVVGGNLEMSGHVINSHDGGAIYFEEGIGSGNPNVDLYFGNAYVNGLGGASMQLGGTGGNAFFQLNNKDYYFRGATNGDQVNIHAKALVSTSKLSTKQDITKLEPEHANEVLLGADIHQWHYINTADQINKQTGVVIDDINDHGQKKYGLPNELVRDDGEGPIDVGSLVGYLIAQNQYQAKQIEELNLRLAKLEVKENEK